jgi:hypothetical protein
MSISYDQVMAALAKQKFAHAKWTPTQSGNTAVLGTCQKCAAQVPAINLNLVRLPFGRGEQWICKECK